MAVFGLRQTSFLMKIALKLTVIMFDEGYNAFMQN